MKDKSDSFSLALASIALVLLLILVSSAASAAPLTVTESRITTSGSASNPDIYDGKIVWQDTRNGGNPDVYMYDISTNDRNSNHQKWIGSRPCYLRKHDSME